MAAVVHEAIRSYLRGRQIAGRMNRNLRQPELLGREPARVPADDDAFAIDHDWLPPAKLLDRCRDLVDRLLWNLAGVPRIGCDSFNCRECDFHMSPELSKAELDCLKRATQGQGGPCRASNITVNGKTTILRLWDAKGNRVHRGVIVVQGPGFSLGASEPPGDPVDFG